MEAIKHIFAVIRRSSSWVLYSFGWALIITVSAHYGLSYWQHPTDWDHWIDKTFILSGFSILLFGSAIREWSRLRKERYANIFTKIEAINSTAKFLSVFLQNAGPDVAGRQLRKNVIQELVSMLDDISDIFFILTGTACRTCIKVVWQDGTKMYVYALARDRLSSKTNEELDKTRYEQKMDSLEENEDFYLVFNKRLNYYVSNNLSLRRNYRNSSFKQHSADAHPTGWLSHLFGMGWTLPYRSAMVFPIQQRGSPSLALDEAGCIGFLTVDSEFRGVFRARFDGPLGSSLAETLFLPLAMYVSLIETADANGGDNG